MKINSPVSLLIAAALALTGGAASLAEAQTPALVNLSARAYVGTGQNAMTSGFVIGPGGEKEVLVRAVGPGLSSFGLSGTLQDPVLQLYNSSGVLLASNSAWPSSDGPAMASVGAFPLTAGSHDDAIVATLPSGAYTAQVASASGQSGVALLEVYDLGGTAPLVNLSARSVVSTTTGPLVSGFIISPGTGSRQVLLRAAGPALTTLGVPGANPAPVLTLYDSQGNALATNSGWDMGGMQTSLSATFSQAGAFPFATGSSDDALLITLAPGSYTIQVTGSAAASGVSLAEVYDVTPASGVAPSTLYVAHLNAAPGASGSTASGTATLQLSPDDTQATISVNFANLSSTEVISHLIIDGQFVFALPQGNVTTTTWTLAPSGSLSVAQIVSAIEAGQATVEIDSATYPGGELAGSFIANTGSTSVFTPPPAPPAIDLSTVSQNDAARFLTQATFGPTQADISNLMSEGYQAWITQQMGITPTLHDAATMADFANSNVGGQGTPVNGVYPFPGGVHRQAAWWKIAVTAPDQLRQRVAFALSQILVVSDQNATVNTWQEGAAAYYDILVNNAFGNFRTLLNQVTLNPIMGVYLSMLRNAQATYDANGNQLTSANENYAREVMQLFTIGLNELNPDGTLQLDATGQPIPTYTQDTIVQTAKVFTGWGFGSSLANADFETTGGSAAQDWITPMMLYPAYHDMTAKTIVNGVILPANQGGAADLQQTLDTLFNHPNTAPFIARRLIQALVTSNPSPGYVYRIAQVFADNGQGVRGDLSAVVRAILTDYEARSTTLLSAPGTGKMKEPIIRATALLRAFSAVSDSGRYNIDAYPSLDEASLRAPTVFNFFEPDNTSPGPIAAAGLYAPESQILNDTTAITAANFFNTFIVNTQPALPSPDNSEEIYLQLNSLLPLAAQPQALVSQLNLLFCSGNMSTATSNQIVSAMNSLAAAGDTNSSDAVRMALYLTVNSPDAAIQQ